MLNSNFFARGVGCVKMRQNGSFLKRANWQGAKDKLAKGKLAKGKLGNANFQIS